jgi:hypothetical protein
MTSGGGWGASPKFVVDARRALANLVGAGAAGATSEAPKTWNGLATRARSLGLPDLADRCAKVGRELESRGAIAFEASPTLADAVLAVHDRVESLASTLMLWTAEESLSQANAQTNGGSPS